MTRKSAVAILAAIVVVCATVVALVLTVPSAGAPTAHPVGAAGFWTKNRLMAASPEHGPVFHQTAASAQAQQAYRAQTGLKVGALFLRQGDAEHFCTASVVNSPTRDLLVTAAHCINSGKGGSYRRGLVFIPDYRDGQAPHGIWTVRKLLVAPEWADASNPDFDVGFVVLNSLDGKNIEEILGANSLAVDSSYRYLVHVTGYPDTHQSPVTCRDYTSKQSASQLRFACGGYTDGTSGSPWVTDFDPHTRTGTIVGVLGGFEEGGETAEISYSALLSPAIQHLYQQAISAER